MEKFNNFLCFSRKKKNHFIAFPLKLVTVILFIMAYCFDLSGQPIIISRTGSDYTGGFVDPSCSAYPHGLPCKIILSPYLPGERYVFKIPFDDPLKKPFTTFEFIVPPVCDEGSAACDGDSLVIEAATPCLVTNDTIIFTVMATYNNSPSFYTDNMTFMIPITRKPVKIAFVLDVSGSMGSITTGGTESRINVLKKAAYLFAYQLCDFSIPDDSCAVTYFTDYLIQPGAPIINGFTPITPLEFLPVHDRFDSVLYRDMEPRTHLNYTAMGMGLIDGKNKLLKHNPTEYTKIVFLFTDGLQNRPPMVNPDGITLTDGSSLNDFTGTPPHDTIHYFPIGICSIGNLPLVLSAINSANSGNTLNNGECLQISDADPDLFSEFFEFGLTKALKGGSPQIVMRKQGTYEGKEIVESFNLNSSVRKLLLSLNFPEGSGLNMKIEKDGKDITSLFNFTTGTYFQMAGHSVPSKLDSKGEFKVRINGTTNCNYSLTTFADDHYLDFTCSTDKPVYTVGDPIKISVKLKYAGSPLTDASNVIKAFVLKPGEDIGDLLATSTVDLPNQVADFNSTAVQKHTALLNNKAYIEALKPSTNTVDLKPSGNDVYTGTFSGTDLTGIYRVYYQMKGQIPGKGIFERFDRVDAVLKFGQISKTKTAVKVKKDSVNMVSSIVLSPINKYKKLMGPGFNSMIKVEKKIKSNGAKAKWMTIYSSSKSYLNKEDKGFRVLDIDDRLDGAYEITTSGYGEKNPFIRISVMDEQFRTRRLSDIQNKWPISYWMLVVLVLIILLLFNLFRPVSILQKIPKWLWWIILLLTLILIILRYYGIILI